MNMTNTGTKIDTNHKASTKLFLQTIMVAALLFLAAGVTTAADLVNLNKASAAAIQQNLIGIGPIKAEAIVSYRKKNGKFSSIDDLQSVKGIGPGLIKKNKRYLSLSKGAVAGDDKKYAAAKKQAKAKKSSTSSSAKKSTTAKKSKTAKTSDTKKTAKKSTKKDKKSKTSKSKTTSKSKSTTAKSTSDSKAKKKKKKKKKKSAPAS